MKKKLPQITSVLLVVILIGCASLLFFSDRGLISLWQLKKEKSDIQQEINSLREEIASLKRESEKLEFDQDYIEKIAREKLKMSKPGEKVFKVEWDYLKTSLATLKDFKSGKWYLIRSEIKLEIIFLL